MSQVPEKHYLVHNRLLWNSLSPKRHQPRAHFCPRGIGLQGVGKGTGKEQRMWTEFQDSPSQSMLKEFKQGLNWFTQDWVQKWSQTPEESPFPPVWEACSHDQSQTTEQWLWAHVVHTQDVCSCLLLRGPRYCQRQGPVRGSMGIKKASCSKEDIIVLPTLDGRCL